MVYKLQTVFSKNKKLLMKKFLTILILVASILFLSAEGYSQTYKIGCIDDYYPYISTSNNGKLEGIIIDWWNLWSEKTGVEIEFVASDIQSCLEKTKTGEIDIISGIFYSDERAEYIDFTDPLMRMRTVIYLKDSIKIDSIQDFSGTLNVVENTLASFYIQDNYQDLKLNTFKSYASLIKAVYLQDIDGFSYDIPNPIDDTKTPRDPEGYYLFETLFNENLRSAVKKGNRDLANLIISGASKISDEELVEIGNKWINFEQDRSQMWWSVAIGLVLLIIIVVLLAQSFKIKNKKSRLAGAETKSNWHDIIRKGENDLIEFKSSYRWDYQQEKVNKALEVVIVKTISAFLNTEGGMLFIGVDDKGKILGLDFDYQTMSKRNSDGLLLTITNLINQYLGKSTHKFITFNIISIDEKDVCVVNIEKSDKPIFLSKHDKEEFYIRASASSQPLGVRESYKYINSHWTK